MSTFQFEWWTVEVREATGQITWEVKSKSKDGAIKQIQKMAKDHNKEIQRMRPDFETEIFWNTLTLNRKGYQRLF